MKISVFIPVNNPSDFEPLYRDLKTIRGMKLLPPNEIRIEICRQDISQEQAETVDGILNDCVKGMKSGRVELKGIKLFPSPKKARELKIKIESKIQLDSLQNKMVSSFESNSIKTNSEKNISEITVGTLDRQTDLSILSNKYVSTLFAEFVCSSIQIKNEEKIIGTAFLD